MARKQVFKQDQARQSPLVKNGDRFSFEGKEYRVVSSGNFPTGTSKLLLYQKAPTSFLGEVSTLSDVRRLIGAWENWKP